MEQPKATGPGAALGLFFKLATGLDMMMEYWVVGELEGGLTL